MQNISDDQARTVANWIAERQYSEDQILQGLDYADRQGGGSNAEVATLAMTTILFSASQIADGAAFKVESLDD
jgi:hypothetical protein